LDHDLDPHHSILVETASFRLKMNAKLQSDDNLAVLNGISLLFEPLVQVYVSPDSKRGDCSAHSDNGVNHEN
jgi:hypothetical protein